MFAIAEKFSAVSEPLAAASSRRLLAAFVGSVPAWYSSRFVKPSWSGSESRSPALPGFRPNAVSQASGSPSPSESGSGVRNADALTMPAGLAWLVTTTL